MRIIEERKWTSVRGYVQERTSESYFPCPIEPTINQAASQQWTDKQRNSNLPSDYQSTNNQPTERRGLPIHSQRLETHVHSIISFPENTLDYEGRLAWIDSRHKANALLPILGEFQNESHYVGVWIGLKKPHNAPAIEVVSASLKPIAWTHSEMPYFRRTPFGCQDMAENGTPMQTPTLRLEASASCAFAWRLASFSCITSKWLGQGYLLREGNGAMHPVAIPTTSCAKYSKPMVTFSFKPRN